MRRASRAVVRAPKVGAGGGNSKKTIKSFLSCYGGKSEMGVF